MTDTTKTTTKETTTSKDLEIARRIAESLQLGDAVEGNKNKSYTATEESVIKSMPEGITKESIQDSLDFLRRVSTATVLKGKDHLEDLYRNGEMGQSVTINVPVTKDYSAGVVLTKSTKVNSDEETVEIRPTVSHTLSSPSRGSLAKAKKEMRDMTASFK